MFSSETTHWLAAQRYLVFKFSVLLPLKHESAAAVRSARKACTGSHTPHPKLPSPENVPMSLHVVCDVQPGLLPFIAHANMSDGIELSHRTSTLTTYRRSIANKSSCQKAEGTPWERPATKRGRGQASSSTAWMESGHIQLQHRDTHTRTYAYATLRSCIQWHQR